MVNPNLIRNAVKYGPVIAGAARRYGPTLVSEARKHAPAVVEEVERRTGRRPAGTDEQGRPMADATPRPTGRLVDRTPLGPAAAKRRATAHARSVVDGSVLQTFLHSRPVFVVFSGDTPVATHPHTDVPYSELLRHADLSARRRPRPHGSAPWRPAPGAPGAPGATGSTGSTPQRPEDGPGDEPLTGTVVNP
ncbi:hypothetical protein ACFFHC_03735 [Kytococcus schroeteri]|uniref:hypothetical protein n=1 Tax=Kytococcus schroeteri TaxID=138300 RepID=UPI0035EF9B16